MTWTASATRPLAEYKQALEARDGQQDTRLAAERGVKTAYAVKGHSCEEDADDDAPGCRNPEPGTPRPGRPEPQDANSGRLEPRNAPSCV